MNRKLSLILTIISILLYGNIVYAESSTSLTSNKDTITPNETFTITLSVVNTDGIKEIDTMYSYDDKILEIVEANVPNNRWINNGKDRRIHLVFNNSLKITQDKVFTITFKVKDNIDVPVSTKISTSLIRVYSNNVSSNFNDSSKSVSINIIEDDQVLESIIDTNNEDIEPINKNVLHIISLEKPYIINSINDDSKVVKEKNSYFKVIILVIFIIILIIINSIPSKSKKKYN